ncbi:hypothetical protein GCM10023205_63680 [Yinghuangia aomiensis]|uniref:S1 motif domain-containing protein n=1 Tax=Yinghuangia aomiensis TaxID=676205 RepID=A0ABP9I116_9ACTN
MDDTDQSVMVLHVGEVRYGVVSAIERFGVFVDLGGFHGMVSAANFTWTHFERFSDLVEVGQHVAVVVLDVDEVRQRVSLSMKELEPDPLVAFARSRLHDTVPGVVDKILPIGTFVRLSEGIVGLVPVDDPGLAAGNEAGRPYEAGDAVDVTVRSINMQQDRVGIRRAVLDRRGHHHARRMPLACRHPPYHPGHQRGALRRRVDEDEFVDGQGSEPVREFGRVRRSSAYHRQLQPHLTPSHRSASRLR